MNPTYLIDLSISHRAWKYALHKAFTKPCNRSTWFNIRLNEIAELIKIKLSL